MKENILNLIAGLKSDPQFNTISVHEGSPEVWEYYFLISGFYGNQYFSVEFMKSRALPEKTTVASVTDCFQEINEKLKQFKIK